MIDMAQWANVFDLCIAHYRIRHLNIANTFSRPLIHCFILLPILEFLFRLFLAEYHPFEEPLLKGIFRLKVSEHLLEEILIDVVIYGVVIA